MTGIEALCLVVFLGLIIAGTIYVLVSEIDERVISFPW